MDAAVESAADRLAGLILRHDPDDDLREIYAFVLTALMQSAAVYGSILILAAALGFFWDSLFWIVFFLAARHWTAGAHAASRLACYLLSVSVTLGCLFAAQMLPASLLLTACLNLGSIVIVFTVAPADPDVKCSSEGRRMRRHARVEVMAAAGGAVSLAWLLPISSFAYAASLGTLSAAVSCLIKSCSTACNKRQTE